MSGYDVISKGKYSYPQPENIIPVESYVFVREEGKKFLLLKFTNTRKSFLTGLDLEITQLARGGKRLGVKGVKYGEINALPEKPFVLTHKIEVDEKCTDIKVKVVAAMYGKYAYSIKGGVKIEYAPAPEEKFNPGPALEKLGWEEREVSVRTLKRRVSIAIVSCVLLALILVFTALYLAVFKRTENKFLYSGIEYEFVDARNKDDCDIRITGYTGGFTEAVIPAEIEGHTVSGIAPRAFADNNGIKTLKIGTEIALQTGAFSGCKNLESIEIEKVTYIGNDVFRGCTSLKSLTAGNLSHIGENAFAGCTALESVKLINSESTLSLGKDAFAGCTSLASVEIGQAITYPASYSVFSGCTALKNLKLSEFTAGYGGDSKSVISLFGVNTGKSLALENVEIGELDAISESFLAGAPVTAVKIGELSSAHIGAYAFDGCPLTVLDIPVKPTSVGEASFRGTKLSAFTEDDLVQIGDYAFYDSALTEFDASNAVTVGDYAFASSKALKLIKFDDNSPCAYLGEGAFSGCTSLVTLTVPSGIRELPGSLFRGCTSLVGVNYAGRITSIGDYAFSQCVRLTELQLTESVRAAGDYAFGGCTSVTSASIPKSMESIGRGMLNGCSNLASLKISFGQYSDTSLGYIFGASSYTAAAEYIPAALKTVTVEDCNQIPAYAFYGCSGVENFILPDTLNSIGEYAFVRCTSLEAFTVPDSVNAVGRGAFAGCENLKEITLLFVGGTPDGNTYLGYIFGSDSPYYTELPQALKTVTVTSASVLGNYSFLNCTGLETVNLPETLTDINYEAFSYCTGLRKLVLPSSLRFVDQSAFNGCFNLYEIWNLSKVEVQAPSVIKTYTTLVEGMTEETYGGFEFLYCAADGTRYLTGYESAEVIKLPDYNTYAFAGFVFMNDDAIREVIIPENVTKIFNGAFSGCQKLKLVTNNSNLEIVVGDYGNGEVASNALFVAKGGDDAGYANINGVQFVHCNDEWAAVWNIDASELVLDSFTYNGKTVDSYIIADFAFSGDGSITSAEISSAVKTIGYGAFASCTSLESVNVKSTALTEIPENAFTNCYSLKTLSLPAGITRIGSSAFQNCAALTSVTLPDAVETVEWYAFAYCNNLKEINLPSSLTEIYEGTFMYCNSLRQITLPRNLRSIGNSAFTGCNNLIIVYNLSSLDITERGYGYGDVARYAVAVLTSTEIKAEFAENGNYGFVTYGGQTYLYSYSGYLTDLVLPETEGKYAVKNYAFENFYVSSAVIPESVESVESNAFGNTGFTVYYRGAEEKWNEVISGFSHTGAVYYYAECVHEYGKWAYDERGNVSTVIDAYGFEYEVTKEPTCVASGTQTDTCPHCGHKIEYEIPPDKNNHEYEEKITEQPGCTENGEKTYECKHCGISYTEPIEKLGHDYGEDGVCKNCGEKKEDEE